MAQRLLLKLLTQSEYAISVITGLYVGVIAEFTAVAIDIILVNYLAYPLALTRETLFIFSGPVIASLLWVITEDDDMAAFPLATIFLSVMFINPWINIPNLVIGFSGLLILLHLGWKQKGLTGAVFMIIFMLIGVSLAMMLADVLVNVSGIIPVLSETTNKAYGPVITFAPITVPLMTGFYCLGHTVAGKTLG